MTGTETTEAILEKIQNLRTLMDERDRRYEDRFRATDEKTGLALTSSKEAVAKAETATEKRFDSVNEFRKTLADQASGFMPRQEYMSNHQSVIEKIEAIKEGFTKEIASLRESRSQTEGRSSGFSASWAIAISLAFLGIAAVGLLLTVLLKVKT
jgi:hypothetical protein